MQPRIVHITTQDTLGGAQQYVLCLLRAYQGKARSSLIIGTDGNGWLSTQAKTLGVPVTIIPSMRREISLKDDLKAIQDLRNYFKKEKIDIVHANSSKAGVLVSLACLLMQKTSRPKNVYTAHGWAFLEPRSFFTRNLFFFMEFVAGLGRNATITLSQREFKVAKKSLHISPRKLFCIPHGAITSPTTFLSKDDARTALGIPKDTMVVIGTIANLYPTKGVDLFAKAFDTDILKGISLFGVVIGDGQDHSLIQDILQGTDQFNRFKLVGSKPNAASYLKAFDIFILPSRKEGLPFALLEAITAGLPIIATDVGGVKEALGDSGLVVPPGDYGALALAISIFATDKKRFAEEQKKTAVRAAFFTQRTSLMLKETWEVYENVLKK